MPNNKSKASNKKKKKTQNKSKKKNTKWLDLKAFNDGYDFGDVTKTIAATTKRSAKNIKKEFTEIPTRADVGGTARHRLGTNNDFTKNRVMTPEASKNAVKSLKKFGSDYLSKGYLKDGYDFGDISKTLIATDENIVNSVSRGAGRGIEGAIDLGAGLFQGGALAAGNKELADKTKKFIQRDLTKEWELDKTIRRALPGGGMIGTKTANLILNQGDYQSGSILADKSDSLLESAGMLGVAALTRTPTPVIGVMAAGGGIEEAYNYKSKSGKNDSASYGEAMIYGLTTGAVEAATEKMGGIKFGGRALDDGIKRQISKKIADKATRALVKTGWTAGMEGFEEIVAGVAQNAAKKLTFADDQTWKQIMVSDEAMEGYLDAAVGGALMGGGIGSVVNAKAYRTGRDADTGLTDNEAKVLDTETNKRVKKKEEERAEETRRVALETQVNSVIADRERSFGELSTEQKDNIKKSVIEDFDFDTVDYSKATLSKRERVAIEKEVDSDLRKGYIDLETIDSTLDPETTTKINELNELRQNSKDEAEQKNIENQIVELYKQRATTSDSLTKNDAYLRESIKQEGLKREAFKYDAKDEQTKALADSFTKAGGKNDGKSHETFEFTAKAVKDFGIEAEFVNNEQLKDVLISNNKTSELKAIEENNLIADAFVLEREGQPNKMFLNVDSPNLTKKVVGHETIHLLESSNEYDKLQSLVKDYATTKGDWAKQESTYADRYKGMKNVSVPKEVTAELLGKYFSADQTFIKDFATKEPNVFKKVYDNIKHLYKMATAGSREARQLQQMKRQFEKVYKEVSKTSTFKAQTKSYTGAPSNSLEFAKAQFSTGEGGYNGKSMSNRAVRAYEDGEMPLSKWNKKAILEAIEEYSIDNNIDYNSLGIERLTLKELRDNFIKKSSWHHTGAFYNQTDFYSLDENALEGINRKTIDDIIADRAPARKKSAEEKINEKRNSQALAEAKDIYAKLDTIYKSGVTGLKSLNSVNSRWQNGKMDLESVYNEAIDTIKKNDSNKIKQWEALPEGHFRKEYVDLYNNDIEQYISKTLLNDNTSSKVLQSIKNSLLNEDIAPVKFSLSKADEDYIAAVNSGDMKTAQSMVDEAAEKAMENSAIRDNKGKLLKVYHGSPKDFNSFNDPNHTPYGEESQFFFSPWKSKSEQYGNNVRAFYLNIENPELYDYDFNNINEADDQGYDGYIYTAEDMKLDIDAEKMGDIEIVAYFPNQAKSADPVTYDNSGNVIPLSQRFNEDSNDIRFSLSEPVEEVNELVAVHNMTVSELERSLDLGGLPMPSIAIIKAQSGHSKYGDVSIVFNKDAIDPKKSKLNKVYGGDAWTPTYPPIAYKVDEKVADKIQSTVNQIVGNDEIYQKLNGTLQDYDIMQDTINRANGDIMDAYSRSDALKYAYLKLNQDPALSNIPETEAMVDRAHKYSNKKVKAVYEELGKDKIDELLNLPREEFYERTDVEDEIGAIFNRLFEEELGKTFDPPLINSDQVNLRVILDAAKNYSENGIQSEPDIYAVRDLVNDNINQQDYEKWITDLFDGVIEKSGIRNEKDIFTDSGNRRSFEALHYENNLENVVKVMKRQENGDALFAANSLWGISAKEYSSINELKKDSGRLSRASEEEYAQAKKDFQDRFIELTDSIVHKGASNEFIAFDNAAEDLIDAVRKNKTKSGILNELQDFYPRATETTVEDMLDLVRDISEMPAEYFEAKPRRAVEFDETAAVIVPDSISDVLRSRLNDIGVNTVEYKAENEDDRLEKLNSLDNVYFSLSEATDKTYLDAVNRGDMETAKGLVKKAAEEAGYTIEAYHGTEDGSFTVFDNQQSDDGLSFFFGNSRFIANSYGDDIIPAYIKMNKPLVIDAKGSQWSAIDGNGVTFERTFDWLRITSGYERYEGEEIIDFQFTGEVENGSPVGSDGRKDESDMFEFLTNELGISEADSQSLIDEAKAKAKEVALPRTDQAGEASVIKDNWTYESSKGSTREFAKYAKENNYDGVIVENVVDEGPLGDDFGFGKGTVYIAFDSTQVKSSEPVTYDNKAEIVPLSERFNPENNDIRFSLSTDSEGNTLTQGQQTYFRDSKVRDENGNLRVVYHGTSSDFSIFNDDYSGMASGDSGFFGRGHYFTFGKGEASMYGRKVIPAYLNIKKPFYFSEELDTYNNERTFDYNASRAVFVMNFADKFPELAIDKVVDVYKEGNEYNTEISFAQFAKEYKDVINNKEFTVSESKDYNGYPIYSVLADRTENKYTDAEGNEKTYIDYKFQRQYSTEKDANNKLSRAYEYLSEVIYNDVTLPPTPEVIMETDFSENLKSKGYDGVMQSKNGDEVVIFNSNQAKLITNENPTEDTDIRFSLTKKELAETYGVPEILIDKKVEAWAKRMANLEDAEEIYNETERFVRDNVELDTVEYDNKEDSVELRQELNAARQYIYKTPLSLYTTGASKGRTVNQLLENVGYDKKTVGRKVNINQKNGISIERMYENLTEIAPSIFTVKDDPYALTTDYITEDDQLIAILDVATSRAQDMYVNETYSLTNEEVDAMAKDYARTILETVYERSLEIREEPGFVESSKLPVAEQQNAEAFANIDENNIPIAEENVAPTEEELANLDKQRSQETLTAGAIDYMVNHAKEMGVSLDEVFNNLGVKGFSDMTTAQYMKGVDYINQVAVAPVNEDLIGNDELDVIVDSTKDKTTNIEDSIPVEDLHGYESKEALQRMLDYQGVKTYAELEERIKKNEAEEKARRERVEAEKKIEEPAQATKKPKIEKQVNEEQNDIITRTRKQLKQELLADNKAFIVNAMDNAKNLPRKLMNNVDTIRNTEMVFGREAGKKINEIIFQRALNNEARRIYWLNTERDAIKKLGIKPKSKMSAAVQKYGERQFVNEYGDLQEYGEAELRDEFPKKEDRTKIYAAASLIRQKYDYYIEAANNVLTDLGFNPIPVRDDYMRHFQELTDAFSRFGIPFNPQSMKEHSLPTHINGITEFFTPQKNYFANSQPRKGLRTTLDAITGIDGYLEGISNLIFHTEDIQRGRAFEDLIRETYGNDENLGWKKIEELPEEEQAARIALVEGNHLSKYASWVHEWTNNMAGKKNKLDRVIEESFDRDAFSVLDWIRKQVGSNMIGLNIASSLTNLIAPMQALAKTKKIPFAKGMVDSFKNIFIKDNFVDNNAFLTSRFGSDQIVKSKWERIQSAGYVFMKGIDHFSSNLIVRSKYYEFLAQGMDSKTAHSEAGQFAARIMGDRSKGANAAFYNSKLFNVVGQFQLEVNNQLYSMFYDTYHESKENAKGNAAKMAAGMTFTLGQMFAYTHLFGKTFEAVAGYNPTFDVIGIIMTALGIGDDDDDKTQSERLEEAAMQLLKALPYSNLIVDGGRIPISKAFPIKELVSGKDQYGNEKSRLDTLKEAIPYYVVPTGYGQIKKTMGGLEMFDTDNYIPGSYTDDGDLRFWLEQTPKNVAQAAVFGQWANPTAREYIDGQHKPLSPEQTKELAYTSFDMEEYWDYRQGLAKEKKFEDKFEYIADLDIPVSEKNVLVNNIGNRKYPIDMGITDTYEEYEGYQKIQRAAEDDPAIWDYVDLYGGVDNYMEYKDALYNIHSDKDASGKTIYNSRKNKVADYINNLDIDYETKLLLWKSQYASDDTYNNDIINYLNERDDISFIQMKRILTDLGFEVGADGSIRW